MELLLLDKRQFLRNILVLLIPLLRRQRTAREPKRLRGRVFGYHRALQFATFGFLLCQRRQLPLRSLLSAFVLLGAAAARWLGHERPRRATIAWPFLFLGCFTGAAGVGDGNGVLLLRWRNRTLNRILLSRLRTSFQIHRSHPQHFAAVEDIVVIWEADIWPIRLVSLRPSLAVPRHRPPHHHFSRQNRRKLKRRVRRGGVASRFWAVIRRRQRIHRRTSLLLGGQRAGRRWRRLQIF